MPAIISLGIRFKEFRERAGLSFDDAAQQMELSPACIWDIENCEDEIEVCYSPHEVQRFCQVFGIQPAELFAVTTTEPPITAAGLVSLIHEECQSRNLTMEQFEDKVGWRLHTMIDPPERLLTEMTIDGFREVCRELHIDWHRVVLSL